MRIGKIQTMAIAAVLATPTYAAGPLDIGYFGLRGSYVSADNQQTTSIPIDDKRQFDAGWGATGFIGFVLDESLRAEIEAGYRVNDIKNAQVIRNALLPASEGASFQADGQVDMSLAMVNLYYDFPIDGFPVLPWVGVGVGGAYVNYQIDYDYGDPLLFQSVSAKDADWQFAYQLMAGVTIPVSRAASVSLGYRYFATEDMTFIDKNAVQFQTELSNHSVDLGVQFHL